MATYRRNLIRATNANAMHDLRVGHHLIGQSHPTFFIAEAGANWRISRNPKVNYRQALRLIDIAVAAGCESVKFQLYRANKLYTPNAGTADYLKKRTSIYDIIHDMELPYGWLRKLKAYCDRRKIMFLCTPFDLESVEQLEAVGMEAYKIASYSVTHLPLIRRIAKTGKPIFMSTGASTMASVERAVREIYRHGNRKLALLQCTAKYPAPLTSLNLRVIPTLQKRFNVPVGLSDHSREPSVGPMAAVALGARVIEKHYTTDNRLPGPDHVFAILPNELRALVMNVRQTEAALGEAEKRVTKDEQELSSFTRYRIFATRDIKKGEPLAGSIELLRSGKVTTGLESSAWDTVVKRTARRRISAYQPIRQADVD